MGITASNYPDDDGGIINEVVPTSSKEWISQHAQACHISESDVRSLWDRFKKLGCDSTGLLSTATISSLQTSPTRTDAVFLHKVLKQFPRMADGGISFQTYCAATKWFQDANIETRVRGAFCILNNGNPLDESVLREVLREVYADTSEAVIQRTTQVFLKEVDVKGQGSISEDDFVTWVQRMPARVVEEIMRIDTLVSATPAGQRVASGPDDRPSLAILTRVAENARNRDWLLLVNKLGFTEEEIREAGDRLGNGNGRQEEQLLELLKKWRSKTDALITVETLNDALVSSGMEDIAAILKS